MFEFHFSRTARDRFGVEGVLFAYDGNAIFASPAGSRVLAQRINEGRAARNEPEQQVQPAALFAMGLIDEATHALLDHYRQHVRPSVITEALAHFAEQVGPVELDRLLLAFVTDFPNAEIYAGTQTAQDWLTGATEGYPHREAAFEELLLLWLANRNPAFTPFRELFDDTPLTETTAYPAVTAGFPAFFSALPELGEGRGGLLALLLSVTEVGGSLTDQLARLRTRWGFAVEALLRRVLLAGDILQEEEVALWRRTHAPVGQNNTEAHAEVPNYAAGMNEYEAFSPDQDWMPRTVMIAKSTFVWLNQLSRFYGREIRTLNQIPDEELETLSRRGMNALWLIGVWERSRASETIKHLCGNPDAVASAYSLYDYQIAEALGGEPAYRDLRDRAARYGVRLASDMVPNHMGIDSPWVVNHPEWFLSRPDSPYPAYSFNGPDLSGDDRVEIKIEDHYYEQSDAAVVFLRRDKWTGDHQYIYHGNDGTSFPWNDTAQLNYLSGAVREQVIQTILQVARQFPIIRFDAAMTLAKRHIQRLWFPTPGSGGAIPSRAESAMTTAEFDAAIPEEFWREVVDRVAREVPGTLLLAEAFWLMEGYFVRTLGMHRVYNSAFMVMLRDEDNANYRLVLKNTLEFDPEIMKRYVNFMSNPDERTAIDQFGSGDKFFGIATLMATLPGLPMFGHGQVEGFTEKYGMEYYRPRYDEWPDESLIERHNREIAPLLHQRWLFAESDNFLLYDCWAADGGVNENVFAFSNQRGGQRSLVVYNNAYAPARGTLHHSAAYMDKGSGQLRQRALSDALALPTDRDTILAWRDNATGLHHLRRANEFHDGGFSIDLHGYGYTVLLDWQELRGSATHPWDRLCDTLHGRGVENLDRALLQLELEPLHQSLREALEPRLIREFAALAAQTEPTDLPGLLPPSPVLEQWLERAGRFVDQARAEYEKRIAPTLPHAVNPDSLATGLSSALNPSAADGITVSADTAASSPNSALQSETVALATQNLLSSSDRLLSNEFTPSNGEVPGGVPTPAGGQAQASLSPEVEAVLDPTTGLIPSESESIADLAASESQNEAALTATRLRARVQALLRLPLAETQFAEPWPPAARKVLPSRSPATNAGFVWAPVLAYTLLSALGDSLSFASPSTPALAAFDAFDLRPVLAQSFGAVEFHGEDTWRAVARVRLLLSAPIRPSEPEPDGKLSEELLAEGAGKRLGLPRAAWQDPDLRWLAGVNTHEGTAWLNRESHEELLWWYALPDLLAITAEPTLDPTAVEILVDALNSARAEAEAAQYSLDPPASQKPTTLDTTSETGTLSNAEAPEDLIDPEPVPVLIDVQALPPEVPIPLAKAPIKTKTKAPATKKPTGAGKGSKA